MKHWGSRKLNLGKRTYPKQTELCLHTLPCVFSRCAEAGTKWVRLNLTSSPGKTSAFCKRQLTCPSCQLRHGMAGIEPKRPRPAWEVPLRWVPGGLGEAPPQGARQPANPVTHLPSGKRPMGVRSGAEHSRYAPSARPASTSRLPGNAAASSSSTAFHVVKCNFLFQKC